MNRANDLVILVPVYNDWQALSSLLPRLDEELNTNRLRASVVLVDDGSTLAMPADLCLNGFQSIHSIDLFPLRRNLGHQRAIAAGLSYIEANIDCQYVVVMDSDGEDDPSDVPRLVNQCIAKEGTKIIFAARTHRSEGFVFRSFYHVYRFIHFLLTGVKVRVGNFSVVPRASLKRLVAVSELWNHYAAAVHKARLPMELMPSRRSSRLAGPSHMDIVALVVHGLSAMAVYGERIGVRLLFLVSLGIALDIGALGTVIVVRLFTDLAIPGWATYAAGLLFVMLIQMLLVLLVFVFVILASRDRANIIPSRDYVHIADEIRRVYGQVR